MTAVFQINLRNCKFHIFVNKVNVDEIIFDHVKSTYSHLQQHSSVNKITRNLTAEKRSFKDIFLRLHSFFGKRGTDFLLWSFNFPLKLRVHRDDDY